MISAEQRALDAAVGGFALYHQDPKARLSWGGPFNGQTFRSRMFMELVARFGFDTIFETGTFRGTTTEFMAQTSATVHTVEASPKNYGFSRARFGMNHPRVKMNFGDSRAFLLHELSERNVGDEKIFFYLDAHWNEDLPLLEECQIVCKHVKHAVVMIDDFEVEGDPDYAFEDYGGGKTLTLGYLAPVLDRYPGIFYPRCAGKDESGAKRGAVILASSVETTSILRTLETLRERPSPRL